MISSTCWTYVNFADGTQRVIIASPTSQSHTEREDWFFFFFFSLPKGGTPKNTFLSFRSLLYVERSLIETSKDPNCGVVGRAKMGHE